MTISPLGSLGIQPETFAQANPFLTGMSAAQQLMLSNQQLAQNQAQLPYFGPQAAANLAQTQAQTGQITQGTTPYLQSLTALNNQGQLPLQQSETQGNIIGNYIKAATAPAAITQANITQYPQGVIQNTAALNAAAKDPAIAQRLQQFGLLPPSANLTSSGVPGVGVGAQPGAPALGQGAQQQQLPNGGQAPTPVSNNLTGNVSPVLTPTGYTGSAAQNMLLYNNPLGPFQSAQLTSQSTAAGKADVDNYTNTIADAQAQANLYDQFKDSLNNFSTAYDKSTYKGPSGFAPSTGLESLPYRLGAPNYSLSNEQLADQYSKAAASMLTKGLFSKVTNYEANLVQQMKPNRAMDPAAKQQAVSFWNAEADRYGSEQPQFFAQAQAKGIPWGTANSLWDQYRNQRPVYDNVNDGPIKYSDGFQGYLTPQAVSSSMNGQPYIALPPGMNYKSQQFKGWYMGLNPQDQQLARQAVKGQLSG